MSGEASLEYTIRFDANGGYVNQSSAATKDGKLESLPVPTRSGYDFVGWYTAPVGGTQVTINTVFTQSATIYAHWEKQGSGNLGNSGENSEPTYSVSLPGKVKGGQVTANKRYAEEGETFRIIVTADQGYELGSLTVTDSKGRELKLEYEGGGEYSFQMPAGRVTIIVSFRETGAEPDPLPFTDVAENAWYTDAVRYVYENGVMSGTSAATFHPNGTISRQQVWMILARITGENPANMTEAKSWAVANGISDGTNPGGAVTRQQLATLLYRYAVQSGYDVSVGESTNILSYTDAFGVAEYAIPAMQWAVGAGIITGTGDGSTLAPQGQAIRAQAAVMLMRFCEKYVNW